MNIYKPFLLLLVSPDGGVSLQILRDYQASLLDYRQDVVSGKIYGAELSQYPEDDFMDEFYSGFLILEEGDGFIAYDLRVNEGMVFGGETRAAVQAKIENYLHSYALECDQDLARKAAQDARAARRSA